MAEKYPFLPGVTSTLEDGGLQIHRQIDLGDSVVILGTAEKGPLNQPLALTSLSEAKEFFGSYGNGTLVRGIFEAYGATSDNKDVRGCRIGNAKKSTLGFPEASAAGASATVSYDDATYEDDGTQIQDALIITALKEGDEYNNLSIRMDYIDGNLSVVLYNPDTGTESVFTYNTDPNFAADVHNVKELADAINADANLNEVVIAVYKDLTVKFRVTVADVDTLSPIASGVAISGVNTRLVLRERLDHLVVGLDAATALPTGVTNVEDLYDSYSPNFPTVGNKIISVTSVYEIATVPNASGTTGQLLVETAGRNSIVLDQTPIKGDLVSTYTIGDTTGGSYASSEVIQSVVNGFVGYVESTGTLAYTWTVDTGVNLEASSVVVYKTEGSIRSIIPSTDIDSTDVTGPTVGVTFVDGGVPSVGSILTVDYRSDAVTITELATKSGVEATDTWLNYFVTGNTIYFGGTIPTDLILTYQYKKQFGIGGEVILENADQGKFLWPATDASPKVAIEAATADSPVILGFEYAYQPEWISLNFNAQSLKGGSDGIVMTNKEKYESLSTALDNLENYEADIFVPMGLYLDDTKEDYNQETAVLETQNAGFHTLIDTFLAGLSEGVNEAFGIMSVKPATGNDLTTVNAWYKKLVETSTSDLTRAANIMAALDSKYLNITAMEPLFINNEVSTPYSATGEGMYAGLISTLAPHSSSTNKRVDRLVGLRYALSNSQLNKLSEKRYVTLRRGGTPPGIVVTDGVTAAAPGSDYVRLSTVRSVFAAMDVVREVAEPFIGEPNDAMERQALETAVTRGLTKMIEARALKDFAFTVKSTPAEQVQGIVNVEMILVPMFEMRKIRVTVKLRPSL